jgi:hypothetical protein
VIEFQKEQPGVYSSPSLARVRTMEERQVEALERIAKALTEIAAAMRTGTGEQNG